MLRSRSIIDEAAAAAADGQGPPRAGSHRCQRSRVASAFGNATRWGFGPLCRFFRRSGRCRPRRAPSAWSLVNRSVSSGERCSICQPRQGSVDSFVRCQEDLAAADCTRATQSTWGSALWCTCEALVGFETLLGSVVSYSVSTNTNRDFFPGIKSRRKKSSTFIAMTTEFYI